jgi:hypothetical protein
MLSAVKVPNNDGYAYRFQDGADPFPVLEVAVES